MRLSFLQYNMKVWQFSVLMAKKFSVSPFYAGIRAIQEKKSKKFQGAHLTSYLLQWSASYHFICRDSSMVGGEGDTGRIQTEHWGPRRGMGWGTTASSLLVVLVPCAALVVQSARL